MQSENIARAVILWISGAKLADMRALVEVEDLLQHGSLSELESSPITDAQVRHYQVLSGRAPASFGFFDSLMPRNYRVVEEINGRGPTPELLPAVLRAHGHTVHYAEVAYTDLANSLQHLSQPNADACIILKSVLNTGFDQQTAAQLSSALQIARAWAGASGLVALLSDAQPAAVTHCVNINNFLAEMGILEREESHGSIRWAESLAYSAGHGQLWVNLLGRDQLGLVHPQDEYEEVCSTLVQALPLKVLDPSSNLPIIERVYRKEELYPDDFLFCAPDLVILFKPGYAPSENCMRLAFDDATFSTPIEDVTTTDGVHPSSIKGFCIVSSPVASSGLTTQQPASLSAFMPTLLHALAVPYSGLASPALADFFTPAYLATHPIRTQQESQELSDEDEELVINRLRDLGYI